jgi:hypothetical protein
VSNININISYYNTAVHYATH